MRASYAALGSGLSPADPFDGVAYARWRALRAREDTRFIGLVLPRILLRQAWPEADRRRIDGFHYQEDIGAGGEGLLWGNAAFAFAVAVLRRFDQSGWFADLRGVPQDRIAGGLVTELPPYAFATDAHGIATQAPVDVRLGGLQEQMLNDAGLIPVAVAPYTPFLLFNSNASLHAPARFDRVEGGGAHAARWTRAPMARVGVAEIAFIEPVLGSYRISLARLSPTRSKYAANPGSSDRYTPISIRVLARIGALVAMTRARSSPWPNARSA